MPLMSRLLGGDQRLQDCLIRDQAHVTPGSKGEFVGKIQTALLIVDRVQVAASELKTQTYGPSTAQAVLAYKTKRQIINRAYQTTPDNIVGKMTIDRLDADVLVQEIRGPRIDPVRPGFD